MRKVNNMKGKIEIFNQKCNNSNHNKAMTHFIIYIAIMKGINNLKTIKKK
jgi:hypothetical protein